MDDPRTASITPPSPANAAAAKPADQKKENAHSNSNGGGVKETVESILVAFILALVFRAFVVEAFVIPTGSMAPTLMGAHMRFRCEDCGYEFEVNYPSQNNKDGEPVIDSHYKGLVKAVCPNCGYKVPPRQANNPLVNYGDRILVLKYLYLLQDPQRWDVVVFKSPSEPEKYDYQQNYIKRLVASPGETVMILDGDVYVAPPDKKLSDVTPNDFTVQTKPQHAQEALWRILYDNDYHPQNKRGDGTRWEQPWKVASGDGWKLDGADTKAGRIFQFSNADGAAELRFDPRANPQAQHFTDWLTYDTMGTGPDVADRRDNYVSDLRLKLYYARQSGDGPLELNLTKQEHRFTAQLTSTEARIIHRLPDGTEQTVGQPYPLSPSSRPRLVEFQNVDYQVTLRIDGEVAVQSTAAEYHPDMAALIRANTGSLPSAPSVSIAVQKQSCVLDHLSLWRDVYYTNRQGSAPLRTSPGSEKSWGKHLIKLAGDEYFVLGDNTLISGDARYWDAPVRLPYEEIDAQAGCVPARFLLGKAFFVYWPAGFAPIEQAPSLVPNFGQMRFIH